MTVNLHNDVSTVFKFILECKKKTNIYGSIYNRLWGHNRPCNNRTMDPTRELQWAPTMELGFVHNVMGIHLCTTQWPWVEAKLSHGRPDRY